MTASVRIEAGGDVQYVGNDGELRIRATSPHDHHD
jgi:hypothetical protein